MTQDRQEASRSRRFGGSLVNRGFVYRERLGEVPPGTTVLRHLCARYRHSSEAEWRDRIASGGIFRNGEPATEDALLAGGDVLEWRRPPWNEPDAPESFVLLHEDEHVLGICKPAGLPTLPGGGFLDRTLLALVRKEHPEATPVHRLGRWTSGVVLFARTRVARAGLSESLRNGTAVKLYRACALGWPEQDRWTVEVPIGPVPHPLLGTVHAALRDGRRARTEVLVVERRADGFLADVLIATGRPHQIRIHLAASGYPLAGDPLYAAGGVPLPETRAVPGDGGYLLHAASILVPHPGSGETVRIEAAIPRELRSRGEGAGGTATPLS